MRSAQDCPSRPCPDCILSCKRSDDRGCPTVAPSFPENSHVVSSRRTQADQVQPSVETPPLVKYRGTVNQNSPLSSPKTSLCSKRSATRRSMSSAYRPEINKQNHGKQCITPRAEQPTSQPARSCDSAHLKDVIKSEPCIPRAGTYETFRSDLNSDHFVDSESIDCAADDLQFYHYPSCPEDIIEDDSWACSVPHQETEVRICHVYFMWTIRDFPCLRDHAYLAALPHMQNFLESRQFGSDAAGRWYLMLFPNGDASLKDHTGAGGVMVKVVSVNRDSMTAKARFVLMDSLGREMSETQRSFDAFKWFQTSLYYNSVVASCVVSQPSVVDDEIEAFMNLLSDGVLRLKCHLQVCTAIRDVPEGYCITAEDAAKTALDAELRNYCREKSSHDLVVRASLPSRSPGFRSDDLPRENSRLSTPRLLSEESAPNNCDTTMTASRFVLCARSGVLRAMLNSDFVEGSGHVLTFTDMTQKTLQNFITFLHYDHCPLLRLSTRLHDTAYGASLVTDAIDLLRVADKYACQNLKFACIHWLMNNLTAETYQDVSALAEQLQLRSLQRACQEYIMARESRPSHHRVLTRS